MDINIVDDEDAAQPTSSSSTSIYEYYQIKNDSHHAIDTTSDDMMIADNQLQSTDGAHDDEPLDNNQIFYLTFSGSNVDEGSAIDQQHQAMLQVDDNDDDMHHHQANCGDGDLSSSLLGSNIKLITLENGRMFMTTADTSAKEENFNVIAPHLITSNANDNDDEDDPEMLISNPENDEESLENEVNYQLIELADGTPTLLQLCEMKKTNDNAIKKEKKFHCEYEGCMKSYATLYHLGVHVRSHMDCKPFACNIDGCTKRFTTNYSLKSHSRTHTGEKPYSCVICPKQFKTSGDLLKHVRVHTGEKPFLCPFADCGKRFTTSNIRKVHVRSHTGERPFSCTFPDCGKAFTSSTNYKNHVRIHSGEKPYTCQVEGCDKKFTEYSSLYKHNAVHQISRPFVCVFCGQGFKQESAMNVHKRIKHNVVVSKGGTEIMVKFE